MGHFHAIPDVVAVAADRLVVIVCVGTDGNVVVRDLANGGLSTTSASELRAPPALLDTTVAPVLSVVQATDAQWERARRREAIIADLMNGDDLSDEVTRASTRLGVSRRTVFRCLAVYRDTPQTSTLLARPGGTPTGARRIGARLEKLIAEVIRDVYLTKRRPKQIRHFVALRPKIMRKVLIHEGICTAICHTDEHASAARCEAADGLQPQARSNCPCLRPRRIRPVDSPGSRPRRQCVL